MNCATSMKQRYRNVIQYGERLGWSHRRSRQLKAQCVKIWDRTRFMDERSILDLISLPLQLEVVAITRADIINRAHLIRDSPELHPVALYFMTRLRLEIFCRGQQIYHFGDPTVGFFIVTKGSVQILSKSDESHATESTATKDVGRLGETKAGYNNRSDSIEVVDTASLFCHSTTITPVGHFGAWDSHNRCRINSALAESDCELYRCDPEDLLNVMERMSNADAGRLAAEFLVHP